MWILVILFDFKYKFLSSYKFNSSSGNTVNSFELKFKVVNLVKFDILSGNLPNLQESRESVFKFTSLTTGFIQVSLFEFKKSSSNLTNLTISSGNLVIVL